MYCILVTGIPAAGKSTIANFIAEKLNIPMISKDGIKEILFDSGSACTYKNRMQNGVGIEMASVIPGFAQKYDIDDLVIDGHGYTIDSRDKAPIFNITGKNITIKNICCS